MHKFTKWCESFGLPVLLSSVLFVTHSYTCIYICFGSRFVGPMDRDAAAAKLDLSHDGAFVVRESTTRPGEYALAVCHAGAVKHLKIDGAPVSARMCVCVVCRVCVCVYVCVVCVIVCICI